MHAKKTEINAPPITSSAGFPAPRSIGSDAVGSAVLIVGEYGEEGGKGGRSRGIGVFDPRDLQGLRMHSAA